MICIISALSAPVGGRRRRSFSHGSTQMNADQKNHICLIRANCVDRLQKGNAKELTTISNESNAFYDSAKKVPNTQI